MAGKISPKGTKEEIKKSKYSASDITVLEGLDPVRKRPGMYIGTTGADGLHHLITEVFDNSRDEAMSGFADRVEVVLLPGNRIRVVDNGRGIPVDTHRQTKVSALETIMTTLHAGAKFGGEGYKVSGGLHGVGVSVVNALSIYVRADVYRDGGHFAQEYEIGKPKSKVKKVGSSDQSGTIITFEPDISIFKEISFEWNRIVSHLRQQAYLVRGMRLTVVDARETKVPGLENVFWFGDLGVEAPSQTFYFEGGLRSLVAFHNQYQKPIHRHIFYVEKNDVDSAVLLVEVALQYVDDISARITAFANNVYNAEHGTHVTGFKTALTRTLNSYARKNNYIKEKDESFTGDDVLEGITVVISVKMPEVQFEGQTKGKLGSVEARGAVETVFNEAFSTYLEENPDDAKAIMGKVILAVKARKAAKAAKDSVLRKGALEGMTLPGKLADCQTKSAEEAELFIVEGDSAGGCWSGDTKVALADGRDLTFLEIVKEYKEGKQNYCYTIDANGSVAVAQIQHPRRTKQNAKIIKIILDTGEELKCTPDHKFMMRDGSYREARDLVENDSLMPLYRKYSKMGGRITIDGYEMVLDPKSHHWIFTHLLSDEYNGKTLVRNILKSSFFSFNGEALEEKLMYNNHRVESVIYTGERMDVYDLEVANTHNFALASGVFVHNSAKMGRDRRTQAILPLRGKILNVERARIDKMLDSEQIKNLVIALGTAIGDVFDLSKLRYHKIIIATDADVDGAHIRTLLLTLFYRYFRPVIDGGYLYIAQPPLYKIQRGQETMYAYTDAEKLELLGEEGEPAGIEEIGTEETEAEPEGDTEKMDPSAEGSKRKTKIHIQRYKGLGEMNAEELGETTMSPEHRILKQVRVEDAEDADRVFDILMGTDVSSRKSFIQSNAHMANLDV